MITFVYPLGHSSSWDNNEIKYSLRSLEKHCKFEFNVVVYYSGNTDMKPDLKNVILKEIPRGEKNDYEDYYDVLTKLELVVKDPDVSDDFVWIYDDVILLKDISDIKTISAMFKITSQIKEDFEKSSWGRSMNIALALSYRNGNFGFCYETHLPRLYEKGRLKGMFELFPFRKYKIPYTPATLYYNFFKVHPDIIIEKTKYRASFYGQNSTKYKSYKSDSTSVIIEAAKNATWLNYNDKGLTEFLKNYIKNKFINKSRFDGNS